VDVDQVIDILTTQGFAVAVAAYLLVRIERTLRALTMAVTALDAAYSCPALQAQRRAARGVDGRGAHPLHAETDSS
jgi:hypothetical protein